MGTVGPCLQGPLGVKALVFLGVSRCAQSLGCGKPSRMLLPTICDIFVFSNTQK